MDSREKKLNFIINAAYYAIIAILIFLFIKYLFGPLLPFICAFIIVSLSHKLITCIGRNSGSKKFASALFTLALVITLSMAVYGLFSAMFGELTRLSENLSDNSFSIFWESVGEQLGTFLGFLSENRLFSGVYDYLSSFISEFDKVISSLVSSTLPKLVNFTVKFISFFPTAVIFLCFMFISVFYIGCDYEKICSFITLQLSDKIKETLDEAKSTILSTVRELFKSYFLLTFITFLQLLVGFLIIGIDYSLLLASIICFIDLLPILGTGTVLVPWAGISFLLGDYKTSVGLLVLYGVIMLFRQLAEPRIIGANTGLSPLLSLISIFVGLKLFGFAGIIIAPIFTITVISLNQKGFIKLYRNFPENRDEKILRTRLKFINFKRNDRK